MFLQNKADYWESIEKFLSFEDFLKNIVVINFVIMSQMI